MNIIAEYYHSMLCLLWAAAAIAKVLSKQQESFLMNLQNLYLNNSCKSYIRELPYFSSVLEW